MSKGQTQQASKGQAAADVKNPVLESQTLPGYTAAAIESKVEGKVVLLVEVRRDGSVHIFRVIKSLGYLGLDEVAIEEIANQWRFRPGTLRGKPVDFPARVEVKFSLR